ncbi:hypothetical protein HHI36_020605 [Cryptolaemus montrouzieri]|uniref:C2 domain-containing protein n=2 Tax=Cryptolaemus montrouzieri TaxID=559131 RepID=A0ABD2NB03_9CUCU
MTLAHSPNCISYKLFRLVTCHLNFTIFFNGIQITFSNNYLKGGSVPFQYKNVHPLWSCVILIVFKLLLSLEFKNWSIIKCFMRFSDLSFRVQDIDGSYFESFTALAWKQENQRQSVLKNAELSASEPPPQEAELGITPIDYSIPQSEKDKLYVEMLYTIANTVGAPAPGGQYAHYKEDLYLYGQRAFGMPPDRHYRMLHMAGEEKPPIVVLSVIVIEAEGLEAKDANGFSDPYCMLGIQPMAAPCSPVPHTPNRTLSDACLPEGPGNHEKLRKHHSFKLSFKRKEGRVREQRDSLGGALPAKFIRATSVKSHTLNPKWNEKFRFDIDDINSDSLHLDIWDHDDESSVLEAVSKLNEVRGVRGLGRFFKQVCQSARQSSQDDFLGCVTIPLQEIPSTGLEGWFKLEARSQRSSVQGRIRLKMWLSTRENHAASEEDNWTELMQHENLYKTFVDYELKNWNREMWGWNGDLPGPALTILHQHAVQGDLTELQTAAVRFVAASGIYLKYSLDPRWMFQLLTDIENAWVNFTLTREEEMWLAEKFTAMQERWLQQLRHHRQMFPALHPPSLARLEYILRCLAYLSNMKSFWKCCPFNKEIRGEIVGAMRKGTPEWFNFLRATMMPNDEYDGSFVDFCTEVYVHLEHGLSHYHPLFEGTNGIPYFSVVFKQIDKLMSDEVISFLNQNEHPDSAYSRLIFSVYLEVKDLASFSQNLPSGGDHKLLLPRCHEWFEPSVSCWLDVCKAKALQRERENWREVVKKRNPKQTRPVPIKGAMDKFSLTIAEQQSCLFLSGLDPDIEPEEVKEYIDTTFKISSKCEKMKTKKDRFKSSFKVYVPTDSKQQVLNENMWGKGIVINHFLHIRRNFNREVNPVTA